jgi:hypothetical protein
VGFPVLRVHLRYRYHSQPEPIRPIGFAFATEKMEICYGAMSYTSAITTVNRKKCRASGAIAAGIHVIKRLIEDALRKAQPARCEPV